MPDNLTFVDILAARSDYITYVLLYSKSLQFITTQLTKPNNNHKNILLKSQHIISLLSSTKVTMLNIDICKCRSARKIRHDIGQQKKGTKCNHKFNNNTVKQTKHILLK